MSSAALREGTAHNTNIDDVYHKRAAELRAIVDLCGSKTAARCAEHSCRNPRRGSLVEEPTMNTADFYRDHAQRCWRLAKRARSEYSRDLFMELTKHWNELLEDEGFLERFPTRSNDAEIAQEKSQAMLHH